MSAWKDSYTDLRGIEHRVRHVTPEPFGALERGQILREVLEALTAPEPLPTEAETSVEDRAGEG